MSLQCERCGAHAYCGRYHSTTPVECDACERSICTTCALSTSPTVTERYHFCDEACRKKWHEDYHKTSALWCEFCTADICPDCGVCDTPYNRDITGDQRWYCSHECYDAEDVREALAG